MLVSSVTAFPPVTWHKGDEIAIFGHSFDEEYWTNSAIPVTTPNNDNLTFSASYINSSGVQAFLLALNKIENANGTGSIPLQLFGMHYTTPEKREVFIGSILAFMMCFDDTYNGTGAGANGLPDVGHENISYVVPFGVAGLVNATYVPQTIVLPVQKLGEGHFKFGIQYLNLYAIITPNFIASMMYKTGWLAKFSEFTVNYEVIINSTNGEVKAETWYTIGQVTDLWLFILGIPIPVPVSDIPDSLGLSVVHYVTIFTSKYQGASGNTTGSAFNPNLTKPLGEDVVLKVGNDSERAMKIGTRGTFDLVNETNGTTLRSADALNAIVSAVGIDGLLVGWQLGLAAGLMSVYAYALSDYVQSKYTGPLDLEQRSLNITNKDGFNAYPLWYAVSFPQWEGYRVVYDPTYTAYTDIAETPEQPTTAPFPAAALGALVLIALIVVIIVAVIAVVLSRSKKKGP